MSSEASSKPPIRGGIDPCWEYAVRVDPNSTQRARCNFCQRQFGGGISRFKKHLAGERGNVAPCDKVPDDVKTKVKEMLSNAKNEKEVQDTAKKALVNEVQIGEFCDDEDEGDGSSRKSFFSSIKTKGPMDKFASPSPEDLVDRMNKGKFVQSTLNEKHRKKAREDTMRYIAKWFYEANLPFNAASLPSFHQMIQAIGQFGSGLAPPTPYELSETLLKREVEHTKETLKVFKESCNINGCSLMTDAWSDRKGRSLMNIVVHCEAGIAFFDSYDTSAEEHNAKFIFELVDKAIEDLGEKNVVQIVTDNASNNMAASNLLNLKRPMIFWTSCAAHTINLMLGDIAKIVPIRNAITMGRNISVFIYSHTRTLSLMRECTDGEIVRPGITRFATSFLSLQSMHEKKNDLKKMFSSRKWDELKLSTKDIGKKVYDIVMSNKFWDNVDLALKVFEPLVRVLRRVDGDKFPSMGFIYGDLLKAKSEIKEALNEEEKKYLPIWSIIDKRWDDKLKTPLHLAGHYLNPYFYYNNKEEIENDGSFMEGVCNAMFQMYVKEPDKVEKLSEQLPAYQQKKGSFGGEFANRALRSPNFNPATWWNMHGSSTPDLKKFAMRILSLTTSSSGCERNWSTFEMIHTKRRNRLNPKKLRNLVFVKFNARLKSMSSIQGRDPLRTCNMEVGKDSEWTIPRRARTNGNDVASLAQLDSDDEEVFPGEPLTWRQVGAALGADLEPRRSVRMVYKRVKTSKGSSSSSKVRKVTRDEDIVSASETEEELEPNLPSDDDDDDGSTSESERGE